jgi:hypothetical protein
MANQTSWRHAGAGRDRVCDRAGRSRLSTSQLTARCRAVVCDGIWKSSHLQGFAPPTSPYCCGIVANTHSSLSFHGLCSPSRSPTIRFRPTTGKDRRAFAGRPRNDSRAASWLRVASENPLFGSLVLRHRKRFRRVPPRSVRKAGSQGKPCRPPWGF